MKRLLVLPAPAIALPEIDGFSFLTNDLAEEERIVRKLLPVTIELPRQSERVLGLLRAVRPAAAHGDCTEVE